jgi:hypothetical protein
MKLSDLDKIIKLRIPDIRIEVYLAELLEKWNIDFDNIRIRSLGLFKRPYSKDILGIEIAKNAQEKRKMLSIKAAREGLYDILPEGLFHQKIQTKPNPSTKDSVEEYKIHQEEEANARKFFLPLEQEFYRERVFLELEERRACDLFLSDDQRGNFNHLVSFWRLSDCLNKEQKSILLYLLPYCHSIVGNLQLTELSMEMVLGKKVKISYIESKENYQINGSETVLGRSGLGHNLVLGESFMDGLPSIKVDIGPLEKQDLEGYLPGGKNEKILSFLFGYFLPIEFEVEVKLLTSESDEDFVLMDDSEVRLGYLTTL